MSEDNLGDVELPFPIVDKVTEKRYVRQSINWGSVAVNPADLVEAYRELFTERQESVICDVGMYRSRTTALAHGAEAVDGLRSNGYKKGEIAVILSILANE